MKIYKVYSYAEIIIALRKSLKISEDSYIKFIIECDENDIFEVTCIRVEIPSKEFD
jgi:hypothetical protein